MSTKCERKKFLLKVGKLNRQRSVIQTPSKATQRGANTTLYIRLHNGVRCVSLAQLCAQRRSLQTTPGRTTGILYQVKRVTASERAPFAKRICKAAQTPISRSVKLFAHVVFLSVFRSLCARRSFFLRADDDPGTPEKRRGKDAEQTRPFLSEPLVS